MASFKKLLEEKGKILNIADIIVPKTQMIHYSKLNSNPKNFYRQDRIEELADSILLAGMVLEPLIIWKTDLGEYEVLAGHRRRRACILNVERGHKRFELIPCIEIIAGDLIQEMIDEYKENGMDAEEAMDVFAEYILIASNASGRGELTDYEKVMQAARLKIILPVMRGDEELKGRALRTEIAKEMNRSDGMIGNYDNIYNHLIPEGMERLRDGTIGIRIASKLCSLSQDAQEELIKLDKITEYDVQRYKQLAEKEVEKGAESTIDVEMVETDIEEESEPDSNSELDNEQDISENDNEEMKVDYGKESVTENESMAAVQTELVPISKPVAAEENRYANLSYSRDDVEHLLSVYKKQVDAVTEMSQGRDANDLVLKKSIIIRDALSLYMEQFR